MKKQTSIQIFGSIFCSRREILCKTPAMIARELGINTDFIIALEAGELESMPINMLYSLSASLALPVYEIMDQLVLDTSVADFFRCFTRVDLPLG